MPFDNHNIEPMYQSGVCPKDFDFNIVDTTTTSFKVHVEAIDPLALLHYELYQSNGSLFQEGYGRGLELLALDIVTLTAAGASVDNSANRKEITADLAPAEFGAVSRLEIVLSRGWVKLLAQADHFSGEISGDGVYGIRLNFNV